MDYLLNAKGTFTEREHKVRQIELELFVVTENILMLITVKKINRRYS